MAMHEQVCPSWERSVISIFTFSTAAPHALTARVAGVVIEVVTWLISIILSHLPCVANNFRS